MKKGIISIRSILDIILKTTKKNANILADSYLIKDPSIISKWKKDKAKPTNDDILEIVNFAFEESSDTQRKIIRNEIDNLVSNSLLKEEIKSSLLHIEDLKEFLLEVLNVSTSLFSDNAQQDGISSVEQDSGVGNSNKTHDSVNYRIKGFGSDTETITAFSDDMEGRYSGIVEFNLVLNRDRGENCTKVSPGKTVSIKSGGSFNLESKIGKLKKQLKSISITSTIVIVVITGFLIAQAANSSQPMDTEAVIEDINIRVEQDESEVIRPLPTEKPVEIVHDKAQVNSDSIISEDESSIPAKTQTDVVEKDSDRHREGFQDTKVKNSDVTTGTVTNTTNNKINNTTDNSVNNITNNTNSIIINEGAKVEGNNNVLGQGSNIFISIGD